MYYKDAWNFCCQINIFESLNPCLICPNIYTGQVTKLRLSCSWFCYQLIAKPGNKTTTVLWPDPHVSWDILGCKIRGIPAIHLMINFVIMWTLLSLRFQMMLHNIILKTIMLCHFIFYLSLFQLEYFSEQSYISHHIVLPVVPSHQWMSIKLFPKSPCH